MGIDCLSKELCSMLRREALEICVKNFTSLEIGSLIASSFVLYIKIRFSSL